MPAHSTLGTTEDRLQSEGARGAHCGDFLRGLAAVPTIRAGSGFMPNPGTLELGEVLTFPTQAFGRKLDPKF